MEPHSNSFHGFLFSPSSLNSLKEEIVSSRERSSYVQSLEESAVRREKENFLLDLISGAFSFNESELTPYLQDLHIQVTFEYYCVMMIHFAKLSTVQMEKLRDCLAKETRWFQNSELFFARHSQLYIIHDLKDDGEIPSLLNYLEVCFQRDYGRFHMGCSLPHHNTEEILSACSEAEICLKNAETRDLVSLSYAQLIPTSYQIPQNILSRLKGNIQQGKREEVRRELTEIFQSFRKEQLIHDNIVFCTYSLLSCLLSALNEKNAVSCLIDQNSQNLFDAIHGFRSLEELGRWVIEFFLKYIPGEQEPADPVSSVTKKIEAYILSHYGDPELTIDTIAKNLYLNYSYICCCFKRDRSTTINDFINETRIQKAMELFHSGIDNVGYVAEKTGFNNAGYFSKKFKKAVGLSPSEYIRLQAARP